MNDRLAVGSHKLQVRLPQPVLDDDVVVSRAQLLAELDASVDGESLDNDALKRLGLSNLLGTKATAKAEAVAGEHGVFDLKDSRVVGVQIAIPEGHPLKGAVDNAFFTDTNLGKPKSAIKQYDQSLRRNRTKDGVVKDVMVEMIIRARKGLALNHLVAKAIEAEEPAEALTWAEQAKTELKTAIDLGLSEGRVYGAAHYNLATLHAHLREVRAGREALTAAVNVDPELFQKLAKKDDDLKPLDNIYVMDLLDAPIVERRQEAKEFVLGTKGIEGIMSALQGAEVNALKMGNTAKHGPRYGIALSPEISLTTEGPMAVRKYQTETTRGMVFEPLPVKALTVGQYRKMRDALRQLRDGGTKNLVIDAAYHQNVYA